MERSDPFELWQFWPGKNQFCWRGRYIHGPESDRAYYLSSWMVLIGVNAAFFVFVCPFLWMEVSPSIVLISAYLCLTSILFFLLTTFTEPGIIPRRTVFELSGAVPDEYSRSLQLTPTQIRYCATCGICRPPRAHHCSFCDNCVDLFDHHCRWVNNCIGKRNYCYFLSFVISCLFLGICIVLGTFTYFFYGNDDQDERSVIQDETTALTILIMFVIFAIILTVLLAVLCCFHLSLMCTGETTKERIKKRDIAEMRHCCQFPKSLLYLKTPLTFNQTQVLLGQRESQV
mmetsp:Transcript_20668/g.38515  ORF Transcript_20668/g.38515 Transcript_20668/m.38515 type:complete len:287 (+) Transcript_20668:24-884(+)